MHLVHSIFQAIDTCFSQKAFRLIAAISCAIFATGCLPKIDKDLPPLSEYQESEGWYEDAFIRVYKRELQAGVHPLEDNFTHPWIVVKRSNTDDIFSFELTEFISEDEACLSFDHVEPNSRTQVCGYIFSTYGNDLPNIDYLGDSDDFILGELRGGDDVNQIAEFILFQSEFYSCRNEYNVINSNSNTYVRAMLEYSGFYMLYEQINEEPFTMGNSSFGQSFYTNCPIELPEESI